MKTRDLLSLSDVKFAQAVNTMKAKECEKHARNYAKILGIDFEDVILTATHAVMFSASDEPVKLRLYKAVNEFVKSETEHGDREATILCALLLVHIGNRLNKVESLFSQAKPFPGQFQGK